MTSADYTLPLTEILPIWPSDRFPIAGGDERLAAVSVTDFDVREKLAQTVVQLTVKLAEELVFQVPGLTGVELVLGGDGQATAVRVEIDVEEPFEARLVDLSLAVRFAASLLKPMKRDAKGDYVEDRNAAGKLRPCEIALKATVKVDAEGNLSLVFPGGAPAISLKPAMIGESGIVIEATDVTLHFNGQQPSPHASLPQGWKGLFIKSASIHFTGAVGSAVPDDLKFADCFIGNGGFSGKVSASWTPPFGGGLLGMQLNLKQVEFEFVQNALVRSAISGAVTLPFFDKPVNVDISLGLDGGLSVALSATQPNKVNASSGLLTLERENLLKMELDSIRFEIADGVLTIKLSGKITPLVGGKDLKWPTFDVEELSIDTEGHLSLTGGWIDLPKGYTLNLYAFKLEITKFGAGRDDNGNQYIGFNGALDLVKGIPGGASVEGLRITWSDTIWPPQVSVKGVGVELTIPDKLHFKGEVSYEPATEPSQLHKFTGAITLELPAINGLAIDGKIVFGSDLINGTRVKYFAIYLEGEFGTGIPLWASGLALTGVAGLFSVNYAPDKPPDWAWYSMDKSKSWFHKPPIGVTDIVKKWALSAGTFALGAGASIATYSDGGYLFNGKFLLLLLFPGPVFLIDGRGSFLEKPSAEKEPLFHALAVLDAKAGSFLIGLDAKWKYDKEQGKLLELAGSAAAYFNLNDPSDWRIAIGKRELEQRIRATFAGGFQANAYFMLNPQSLAVGVWIGKKDHYQFGPVSADLEAWLDANAVLSFYPAHLHAALQLYGRLAISLWKLRLGIALDARLEADVLTPFHILGSLQIRIETWLKDFEFEIRLEWGPQAVRPQIPGAFRGVGIAHPKTTVEWPLLESAPPPEVPMDSRLYLTFEHPVHDLAGVGINTAPDPGWIVVGDPSRGQGSARVHYELRELALDRNIGDASNPIWTPFAGRSAEGTTFPRPLYGSWAAVPPNPGAGGAAAGQNRLMVWAKTPFELTDGSASWNPWVADNLSNYPCPVTTTERVCIVWEEPEIVDGFASPWVDAAHPEIRVSWDGGLQQVVWVTRAVAGLHWGLQFAVRRSELAYVASESTGTVAVIDTATDTVVGTPVRVGSLPVAVAFTPDGSRALVANNGDSTVSVIDTATSTVLGSPVAVGGNPLDIVVSGDGANAYVTSGASRILSVIDITSRTVIRRFTLHDPSNGIAILPDGSKIYVVHTTSGTLSVIDPVTDRVLGKPIPAPGGPRRMAITADGRRAYVPGSGNNRVAVLDTTNDTFTGISIEVGDFPRDLTIAPNGSQVYVANGNQNTVSVIDTATQTVVATIPVGKRPLDIAITPDGAKAYVAHYGEGTAAVISTGTLTVSGGPIQVGGNPQAIAISPVPIHVEPLDVFIEVPKGTAVVELLAWSAAGTPAPEGQVVEPLGAVPQTIPQVGDLLRFDASALGLREGINRVRIRIWNDWVLLRVCIEHPSVPGGLAELARVHDQLAHSLSIWGEPQEVLAPLTGYRLRAVVRREIEGLGALVPWSNKALLTLERAFSTGGPPGLTTFKPPAGVSSDKSAVGLDDLTRYVEQTIPTTLAPAGARPELQKPVFRAYDIGVQFNEDYVDRMYELAGRDLAIRLYDTSDKPVRTVGGGLIAFANRWGDAATVTQTETTRRWIETLNAASCLPHDIDVETIPRNKTLATSDHVLDAGTLYEARLVPLLLRAITPGGDGWTEDLEPGVLMRERTKEDPVDPKDWTDVLIQVALQPLPGRPTGVVFRAGANGRYEFSINAKLGKRTLSGLAGPNRESAFTYDPDKMYQLSIEAIGTRLRIEQDGELVFDVEDARWPSGSLGLFPWVPAAQQRFQDLSVHDFRKGAPVAYRFRFTTSEYVDFFHQIHSYQDETWPGTLPASLDLSTLGVRGEALATPASEQEARDYEALADALLDAAARQLPARLEVTRVEQGSAVPALLVRSPEPIDWRRTTMAVLLVGDIPPAAVEPGVLKLTSAAFGVFQIGGEVASVLLREALDPTGYRIEVRLPPAEASEPALLDESFDAEPSSGWSFEEEGKATPPWEVRDGELFAPKDRGPALGVGLNGTVHALALAGEELYAAGAFQQAGGQTARRVALWDGTAWSPLGVGLNGTAFALAVVGDEVYVGGQFNRAGGQPAANVAVWNRRTQSWSPLGSGVNGMVLALTAQGNSLYVGGRFTLASGITVNRMARWDLKARAWSALGSGFNSRVNAIAVVGQNVYAGGAFTSAGGVPANRVALWNGKVWSALGPGVNGEVFALAAAGRELWAGGLFTQAGGAPASHTAVWNGRRWLAMGAGMDGPVRSLALIEDSLYAAGGAPVSRLARWSRSRRTWSSVAGGVDGEVRGLVAVPGAVYLAGDFSAVGGAAASRVARVEVERLRAALAGEPGWDDYRLSMRLMAGEKGTTELLFRYQAPDRFYALRFGAESGSMRLIKTAGGQETVLWESPWTVSAGSETLVTMDCFGELLMGSWNGERMFQVVDAELPAGRVGLRVRGETGTRLRELRVAAPVWALWYAFEQERKRAAGTHFEVHAGETWPGMPPPEPGVIRKLTGSAGPRPLWPQEGVDLRLVGPGGKVEHARRFLPFVPFEAFTTILVRLVRSADGTGFFLLPDPGPALAAGTYRLAFLYERDKSDIPERVAIDVPWSTHRR